MENWNIKEETGKQYVYVSKLGDDATAKGFFGYADVWQSDTVGYSYITGTTRRDSASSVNSSYKQFKCIKAHTKIATTPNADAVNWAYDTDCYQEYLSTATYPLSGKTVYLNEHYVCLSGGTTGAFDLTKWTKVVISNKDYPALTMNFNIVMINGGTGYNGGRFISYELLDYSKNKAYHNINMILGLGTWTESLTAPTKYMRFIGVNKYRTIVNNNVFMFSNTCFTDTLTTSWLTTPAQSSTCYLKSENCIKLDAITYLDTNFNFIYLYKNIFVSPITVNRFQYSGSLVITHMVCNNIKSLISNNYASTAVAYSSNALLKNNYFDGSALLGNNPSVISSQNVGYNYFGSTVYISTTSYSSLATLQAVQPSQHNNSVFGVPQSFNSDYTLVSDSSPLYRTGQYQQNIGAVSLGFKRDETDAFSIANGAVYKNISLSGSTLQRDQISKSAQGGGVNTITLNSSASSTNDEYNNFRIKIVTGTGSGQVNIITAYDGATKIATVVSGWTTQPDSLSVYTILDGECYSAKIDLGRVVRVRNLNFIGTLISDGTGKYTDVYDWDITSTSKQPKLTFKMNYSTDDVTYSGLKEFLIDEPLRVDSNGYGNGDGNFVRVNQMDGTLNIRYAYVNIALKEII